MATYTFKVNDPRNERFDDYVERDLDAIQTASADINSGTFAWTVQTGGLVLSIAKGAN